MSNHAPSCQSFSHLLVRKHGCHLQDDMHVQLSCSRGWRVPLVRLSAHEKEAKLVFKLLGGQLCLHSVRNLLPSEVGWDQLFQPSSHVCVLVVASWTGPRPHTNHASCFRWSCLGCLRARAFVLHPRRWSLLLARSRCRGGVGVGVAVLPRSETIALARDRVCKIKSARVTRALRTDT